MSNEALIQEARHRYDRRYVKISPASSSGLSENRSLQPFLFRDTNDGGRARSRARRGYRSIAGFRGRSGFSDEGCLRLEYSQSTREADAIPLDKPTLFRGHAFPRISRLNLQFPKRKEASAKSLGASANNARNTAAINDCVCPLDSLASK